MKHKFRTLTSISAVVSLLSFHAVGNDTLRPKPAGSDQSVTFNNATGAGGLTWFELDARNADLAVTARIREEIKFRKHLSVNARNVKIITTGCRVVLKGAVITTEEKRLIGDIAIGVQRRENVDNQLVVGLAPSAPTGLKVVQ